MSADRTAENPYRLPRNVHPTRYDLALEPDLGSFTFSGRADIAVTIEEPVSTVVVNAVDLAFGEAWVAYEGGSRVDATQVRLDPETERAHLIFSEPLGPGNAALHIDFTGEINERMRGFYRSRYTDASGAPHTLATTQMQPVDARSAFPCWDEPDFKAVFSITLVVPDGMFVASNGPEVARESAGEGKSRVRFADTMKMSSYLVAFMCGDLEVTDPVDVDGTPVRVIHAAGRERLTSYALDVAAHAIRFFSDYYAIPYPERKLDLAALPDFAAGAMENPGLVTFRETALLIDPENATQPELSRVAETIAHEIAHMWFGDLVTMRWWNGTWLNEAFATFMALICLDAWKPEWKTFETYALGRTEAFEVDSLSTTRPIEAEVVAPSDVDNMFDALTYLKGGAVLWMLERYLGEERFRDGIRRYLRSHAYGNTETHELWSALEDETGHPVREVMDAWIWRGGFPLVTVSSTNGGASFHLAQQRFSYTGDDGTRWPTPLRVRVLSPDGQDTDEALLLNSEGATVMGSSGASLIGNAGGSSFVRTRYDADLFSRMAELAPSQLSALERYVLVDDTWAAVVAGAYEAPAFLELARTFTGETDASVWKILLGGLSWCDRMLDGQARESYRSFVRELAGPAMARAGWEPREGESDLERDLRGTLLSAMGGLGRDPEAIAQAVALERAARDGARVDAALAAAAVTIAARTGGADEWDAFFRMYSDGATPQIQRRYLFSLAAFPQADLAQRSREKLLDGSVRPQDLPFLASMLIANRENGTASWAFVKEHWEEITDGLPPLLRVYAVEGVRMLPTRELRDDVVRFFHEHPAARGSMQLTHTLERHAVAIALRERESARLATEFSLGGRFV
jgi:puromycin-sensitive aminopeptidase